MKDKACTRAGQSNHEGDQQQRPGGAYLKRRAQSLQSINVSWYFDELEQDVPQHDHRKNHAQTIPVDRLYRKFSHEKRLYPRQ